MPRCAQLLNDCVYIYFSLSLSCCGVDLTVFLVFYAVVGPLTATVPFDAIDILLGDHRTPNSGRNFFRQVTDSAVGNVEMPGSNITGIYTFLIIRGSSSYATTTFSVQYDHLTHCAAEPTTIGVYPWFNALIFLCDQFLIVWCCCGNASLNI